MSGHELRQAFLSFFESKGHTILPGMSLVSPDPSAILTVAGVVAFRGIIEGVEEPPAPRVADFQRCVRTIDIDAVGDESHCTFFEMLGNWSFGDYYKRESLNWGWEFLTEVVKLPKNRLWCTIYKEDDEARQIWREIGMPEERITPLEADEIFWGPVGETGACGPCSEIHYDLGAGVGCDKPDCTPACDCGRFLEVWNHVFTEYRQLADGSRVPLPKKNIDTGMGLERLTCVSMGKLDVYETDLYKPLFDAVTQTVSVPASPQNLTYRRIIADHLRCATMMIMDSIRPSNEERGYVLRRLLRRAIRSGKLLGMDAPFLHKLVPVVTQMMAPGYPQLPPQTESIAQVVRVEEEGFYQVLEQGMKKLDDLLSAMPGTVLDGKDAFRLYDTFGFPLDLTRDICVERGFAVDEEGFRHEMESQRARARSASQMGDTLGSDSALLGLPKTVFLGYDTLEGPASILAVLREGSEVVLDRTPFYAESGGQIGDTGVLLAADGATPLATVKDTRKVGDVFVHELAYPVAGLQEGQPVLARVDEDRRAAIRRAHTATHLLQAALRKTLGTHVQQSGSLVEPDRLRFDFSHFAATTPEELQRVEELVNRQVLLDSPVDITTVPYQQAIDLGAMALFGEKYGAEVRTVKSGDFSLELCGGTHVERTGWIGLVKVTSETSIGSGVRRVEAVTGLRSLAAAREQEHLLSRLSGLLTAAPAELPAKVERLRQSARDLERQLAEAQRQGAVGQLDSLVAQARDVDGVKVVAAQAEGVDAEGLKALADAAAERLGSAVLLLAGAHDGRVSLVSKVTPDLLPRGLHAGNLLREVAKVAGGGGGGRPEFAQGAVKDASRVGAALEAVEGIVASQLQA
jgi:alanyl-tRNA synthetase